MVLSDACCDLQATLSQGTNTWEKYPGENPGEIQVPPLGKPVAFQGL